MRRVARRGRARRLHALVEAHERTLHRAQQCLAGAIEHDATAVPIEQRKPRRSSSARILLAHGTVREVQLLGGGAQVLRFGDGAEGTSVLRAGGSCLVSLAYQYGRK